MTNDDDPGQTFQQRALNLRGRIKAAGLSLAEFQRRSGLSRNVVYNLARGQKPNVEQELKIETALSTKNAPRPEL
jgi:transcriptional regulator with XRE-family HTH domain